MAKKSGYSKGNIISILCFAALIISTVCFILQACGVGAGILSLIANICLIIAVVWSGWSFAKSLGKTWKIVYIVLAVIAVVATVFGSGVL